MRRHNLINHPRPTRTLTAQVTAVAVLTMLLAGGCANQIAPSGNSTPTVLTEDFGIVPNPPFSSAGVSPVQPITITVTDGTLLTVTLTNGEGSEVSGTLSDDQRRWTATEPLGFGKRYTWSGTAFDAGGKRYPINGSFQTLVPEVVVGVEPSVAPGGSYDTATPIVLRFTSPIPDPAAVRRVLTVETHPSTPGGWSWHDDRTAISWRPTDGWQPGTTVRLLAKLYSVQVGDGQYGATDVDVSFRITRG